MPAFDSCVSDWPCIAMQGEGGASQLTQVTCRNNRPAPATCDSLPVIGQLQPVLACDWLGHYWASSVRHWGIMGDPVRSCESVVRETENLESP